MRVFRKLSISNWGLSSLILFLKPPFFSSITFISSTILLYSTLKISNIRYIIILNRILSSSYCINVFYLLCESFRIQNWSIMARLKVGNKGMKIEKISYRRSKRKPEESPKETPSRKQNLFGLGQKSLQTRYF